MLATYPWPKCTPSANRLNTGDKLTITSSVTKNVYIRPCILLIRYHMQIYVLSLVYLPLLWSLETQFFESKLVVEKISCLEMTNFQASDTLTIYSNISKIRLLIQITLCRNARIQMDISKKNRFSPEKAINYLPSHREEK